MDVPEPRTVTFSGAKGMLNVSEQIFAPSGGSKIAAD